MSDHICSHQLLQLRGEQQEKLAEMKTAEANITALTRERDRLLETMQSVRDEREQLEKSETVTRFMLRGGPYGKNITFYFIFLQKSQFMIIVGG